MMRVITVMETKLKEWRFAWASGLLLLLSLVSARVIELSNTALPKDSNGDDLITGEASFFFDGESQLYYAYFNNWGECAGVDCCPSSGGCASCCFNPPSGLYPDACVYTANHSVVAYSTPDFQTWTFLGEVLSLSQRRPGVEFRPQVLYSPYLKMFLMWYEDRWTNGTNHGYAINAATTPHGPFLPYANSVSLPGPGRIGDYDLFIDDDGQAYHVRTGLTIVLLNQSYTGPTGQFAVISAPNVEAPAMFKRNGVYFILAGRGCCACRGGSNIEVYSASAPLGPYTARGDIGSRPSPFQPHSPLNYVTSAQLTKVIRVPSSTGAEQWLWVGNQWVTSQRSGHPRNNDLLYWTLLAFGNDTTIAAVQYSERCVLDVK